MIAITATLTEGATLVGAVFYPHGASGGTCYYAFDAYAGYDLAPLLQHSATRSVVAVDNAMGQLHDDTPSGFADWASATLDAPVGVFKVEASSSGRWPGNPNIVAEWETYKVTGQSGLLGFQFVAVEPYNLAWALAKSSSDGPPAQRIVPRMPQLGFRFASQVGGEASRSWFGVYSPHRVGDQVRLALFEVGDVARARAEECDCCVTGGCMSDGQECWIACGRQYCPCPPPGHCAPQCPESFDSEWERWKAIKLGALTQPVEELSFERDVLISYPEFQ